jgi:hypothetical protein
VSAPVSLVLDASRRGATTRSQLAARTGLDPLVVDASVDHLLRLGLLASPVLQSGCAAGGCHGCAVAQGCTSLRA